MEHGLKAGFRGSRSENHLSAGHPVNGLVCKPGVKRPVAARYKVTKRTKNAIYWYCVRTLRELGIKLRQSKSYAVLTRKVLPKAALVKNHKVGWLNHLGAVQGQAATRKDG